VFFFVFSLVQEQGQQSKITADMLLSREQIGHTALSQSVSFTCIEWVCPSRA